MDEKRRIKDLFDYQIVDTPAEAELNELAEIASLMCNTPIALITLIDENDQWFYTTKGVNIKKTHRKHSFCQHVFDNPKKFWW